MPVDQREGGPVIPNARYRHRSDLRSGGHLVGPLWRLHWTGFPFEGGARARHGAAGLERLQ